ncbi:MAG: glycosyltransferase WbuB, partial [Porphyromonadaceae bacterium]|nr:glycosyltransferase WbuB [Porphyromonadaceae bacterium]
MNKSLGNKMNLWIVTELFTPDETSTAFILNEIANKLSSKYNVKVIAGPIYNPECVNDYHQESNIEITRVHLPKFNKNKVSLRIIKFITLSLKLVWKLCKKLSEGDKVLIVTNPAPLIVLTALLRRIKKFELVVLVHDVFPENTIPANI